MTPQRWAQLAEIFAEALDLEGTEREGFVAAACEGDGDLYREACRLLASHEHADDFLSNPALTPSGLEPLLFEPRQVIAARFRIVRFIARGGMGEVYEAEDLALSTKIALKAIQTLIPGEGALELFKQEILSARRVTHPNVCRIYDLAEHGDPPVTLLTMELLDGPTLSRHCKENGPFSRSEALPLIRQMCAGLQAAHDAGVIHRDFKSGNVILVRNADGWRPVITDFGLAFPAGSRAERHSAHGGTPGYMAPEQLNGGAVTPATDVYALGVVITRMTGGGWPVALKESSSPSNSRSENPKTEISSGPWKHVIARCVEHDAAKRYQRPMEVADALRRSSMFPPGLMAIAVIALVGLLALLWYMRSTSQVTKRPGPLATRQISTGPEAAIPGRVSPDGRLLAFTDPETFGLSVHDLGTGENRPITRKQPGSKGQAWWPVFDSDGQQLAYTWLGDGPPEVRIVNIDGSAQKTILRLAVDEVVTVNDWSPDGKLLLVRVQRQQREQETRLISASDGNYRVVPTAHHDWHQGSLFSPDGKYVVFDALQEGGDQPQWEHSHHFPEFRQRGGPYRAPGERLLARLDARRVSPPL